MMKKLFQIAFALIVGGFAVVLMQWRVAYSISVFCLVACLSIARSHLIRPETTKHKNQSYCCRKKQLEHLETLTDTFSQLNQLNDNTNASDSQTNPQLPNGSAHSLQMVRTYPDENYRRLVNNCSNVNNNNSNSSNNNNNRNLLGNSVVLANNGIEDMSLSGAASHNGSCASCCCAVVVGSENTNTIHPSPSFTTQPPPLPCYNNHRSTNGNGGCHNHRNTNSPVYTSIYDDARQLNSSKSNFLPPRPEILGPRERVVIGGECKESNSLPPRPPSGGFKPGATNGTQSIMQELQQIEQEEEKHLRRMMHLDSSDDCTTLTRLFFQETSLVHGVARAAKVSSDYRRVLWIILVLGSFAGFTWQTCSLLVDFFGWPVSVVTQMEDSRTLTFPAISICNMNKIKSSKLGNTRFASLTQLDKYAEEIIPTDLSQYMAASNNTETLLMCNYDTEWSCPGVSQCIPREWRCNRVEDCVNGADEHNCVVCQSDFWELPCPGVEECMKIYDFCDGVFQCSDGSDEDVCSKPDWHCPSDLPYSSFIYQCNNTGRCIEYAWLGDSMNDCGDNEDEDPDILVDLLEVRQELGMEACGNDSLQLIMTGWRCDGYPNCNNSYDEKGCQIDTNCSGEFYLCEEGYTCIVDSFKCDDFIDCRNASDEQFSNCPNRIECEPDLIQCPRSTYCMLAEWQCNGFSECMMGEEEDKFLCSQHQCLPGQIPCSDGSYPCIYEWQWCDGIIDCPGRIDESSCAGSQLNSLKPLLLNCSVENGRIPCEDNSRCIKKEWRCDGYQDCDTPVDERDCDIRVTCSDISDKYKSCPRWAAKNYCEISNSHYTFMKEHCAKTCQFCIKDEDKNGELGSILGDTSNLVSNRHWQIYYETSKHEDYSDVVDLGMMTREEIKLLGHQQDEFIIQCTFDGKTCSKQWFTEFQNDMYGNCWTFNDASGQNGSQLHNISQAGVRHALQLTIFLDVANYLGILSHRTGARLSIQDPKVQPFPDELGITLTPGRHTSIGVRQQTLSRQTGRYGSCVHSWPPNMQATLERNNRTKRQQQSRERSNQTDSSSAGASSGLYGYSHLGCSKMCIQAQLLETCGCVDSLLLEKVTLCNIVNITQEHCRKSVYGGYQSGQFGCQCSQPCHEMFFTKIVSESTWPNTKYMHHMIRRLLKDESELVRETTKDFLIPYVKARIAVIKKHKQDSSNPDQYNSINLDHLPFNDTMYYRWFERDMMEMLRQNFLRVEVYFEALSYEHVREQPQYGWEHLLSNIGGALGLWLGLSIITVFEFCELIFDLHRIVISSRYKRRQEERKKMLTQNYRRHQMNSASMKNMQNHHQPHSFPLSSLPHPHPHHPPHQTHTTQLPLPSPPEPRYV
ncbi:uncharacterized protein LOC134853378 [Symsagittifera roscoffensis]|uniref:uncharacterized protein LOC134853378 n=1 Tax=Symsagittifera roscoffensis TaxID=84072 RepID=UPI00307C6F84